MKNPTSKKVILASNSPRRRQLLAGILTDFEIAEPRDIDESYPETLPVNEVAAYLSRLKAEAYRDLLQSDNMIITADTVVVLNGKILGKPHNTDEAYEMLKGLSGNNHIVITGVTLKSAEKTTTFSSITKVTFDEIEDRDIYAYIEEFRPFDKAGSYGIQEWIGYRGIKKIEGCYYNVMGLPLNDLYNHLRAF